MNAFDRYAPFIQDFIYSHDWESLRSIQVAAADAIFNTQDNVLLTASTASGKTEAAFFPILTEFWENPPASVGALYIGPLKALINDQFVRLNDLCEEADIPVWHWHGDVSQSHKAKLIKKPSGILQITPESLEALLIHKHMAIPRMFCDLRYVVIDEVHSLMRGDRGGQTLCLIERLSHGRRAAPPHWPFGHHPATPSARAPFSRRERGATALSPAFEEPRRVWRISMEHFYNSGPRRSSGDSRAWVLKRPKCLRASVLRRRRPRLPASGQDMCRSGQLAQEERRQRREQARGKAAPKDRSHFLGPRGAKSTSHERPSRRFSTPPTRRPTTPTPVWAISLSIRAAASALSLPTRARRQRPCAPCCAATARAGTSPTAFSSITAIFRHRYARAAEELMRGRGAGADNRHHLYVGARYRYRPPGRARFRSMRHLPSAPFCSEWAARDAANFHPRCGLSCARRSPNRAR